MMKTPKGKRDFRVLRGTVENVEGSQSFSLIAWSRFDLGYTKVLVHDLFLLPPRLSEGDEVVVAGRYRRNRFDAVACLKPDEPAEEHDRRMLAERRRKRVWTSLGAACLLTPWLWALFADPAQAFKIAPILVFPVFAWFSKTVDLRQGEMELTLALLEDKAEPANSRSTRSAVADGPRC